MRFPFYLILFCLICLQSFSQTFTAITHVNIVDVKNEKIIPEQTVLIKGDRIEKIGSNIKLPKNTFVISGKNKFLIPGLWDMHFHNDDDESSGVTDSAILPLLIANGVTGVRDMFGLDNTIKRRDSIRAGSSSDLKPMWVRWWTAPSPRSQAPWRQKPRPVVFLWWIP